MRLGPVVLPALQLLGEMGLFRSGLWIVMNVPVALPIAQSFHQGGDGVPEMEWNPKVSVVFSVLQGFQEADVGRIVLGP